MNNKELHKKYTVNKDVTIMINGEVTQYLDKNNWKKAEVNPESAYNGDDQSSMIHFPYFNKVSKLGEKAGADSVILRIENDKPVRFDFIKDGETIGNVIVSPQVVRDEE